MHTNITNESHDDHEYYQWDYQNFSVILLVSIYVHYCCVVLCFSNGILIVDF